MFTDYLKLAKEKRNVLRDADYNLPLVQFLAWCYLYLTPASYGVQIQKLICHMTLKLKEIRKELGLGDFLFSDETGEFKVTFLSSQKKYSLTHLRPWQQYKYYMICFVDCDSDFTPEFYLIKKEDLTQFNLQPMSGTKKENKGKKDIELRVSIIKSSEKHQLLKKLNLLKDTSLEGLKMYVCHK